MLNPKQNLIRLIKEISSKSDAETIVSDTMYGIFSTPGQLYSLADNTNKELCIEFLSTDYKRKEDIYGSNPNVNEYALVVFWNDDIVYDEYFQHDVTDKMIEEVKEIWYQ